MADQWYNEDGLIQRFRSNEASERLGSVKDFGAYKQLVVDFDYANLPTYTTDRDNDGTNDGFNGGDVGIDANASIVSAKLIVGTAFVGGTSYNIGLYEEDGTVIDADGIDAAVATAALTAGTVIDCDGALVGETVGAAKGHLVVAATGTFTAGTAKLVIEYV